MNNKVIRAALYIRVSTGRQAKEGDSLEAQEEALESFCKEKNYFIVDKYIDGGLSGQKINRTNLQRMLDDVKNDKIDIILMTKLDRWFRNVGDFYKVADIIKKHNTNWKTIWEDYDTTTASGEFWLNMSLSMGQLEAKRTSERIKEVFDYKYEIQKSVCTGKVPYGYKLNKEKKIIIDKKKSKNVVNLFEYYAKTNNLAKTHKWFCENIEKKSLETVKKYLYNSAYIGQFKRTRDKKIIQNYVPRIINQDLWEKVQRLIKINIKKQIPDEKSKRHNTRPYIFSGLLICGECNHILAGKTNCNSNHFYSCRYHYFRKCSNKNCINEKWLERYLLENIVNILNTKKIEISNIEKQNEFFVDNTAKLQAKLQKLVELHLENIIDIETYKKEYESITNQLNEIQKIKAKQQIKKDYSYIDNFLSSDFLKIYNMLDNLEKRRLWATIIDKIIITDKSNINVIIF